MISVVNYGVANIGSMLNMLKKIGVAAHPVSTAAEVEKSTKIILPGVGAFDNGMKALNERGLAEAIRNRVAGGTVPLLGVCLGMQMLGEGSEEGTLPGLNLIAGRCVRFRSDDTAPIRIPHMGWNELMIHRQAPIIERLDGARFYFVHSYHLVCRDDADRVASVRYGVEFTAVVERGNVAGVQFHPEKSHRFGMALLKNFAGL